MSCSLVSWLKDTGQVLEMSEKKYCPKASSTRKPKAEQKQEYCIMRPRWIATADAQLPKKRLNGRITRRQPRWLQLNSCLHFGFDVTVQLLNHSGPVFQKFFRSCRSSCVATCSLDFGSLCFLSQLMYCKGGQEEKSEIN